MPAEYGDGIHGKSGLLQIGVLVLSHGSPSLKIQRDTKVHTAQRFPDVDGDCLYTKAPLPLSLNVPVAEEATPR